MTPEERTAKIKALQTMIADNESKVQRQKSIGVLESLGRGFESSATSGLTHQAITNYLKSKFGDSKGAKQIADDGLELSIAQNPNATATGEVLGSLAQGIAAMTVGGRIVAPLARAASALGIADAIPGLASSANVARLASNTASSAVGGGLQGGLEQIGKQKQEHISDIQWNAVLNDVGKSALTSAVLHSGGEAAGSAANFIKKAQAAVKSPEVLKAEQEAANALKKSDLFKAAHEQVDNQMKSAADRLSQVAQQKDQLSDFIDQMNQNQSKVHPSVYQDMKGLGVESKNLQSRMTNLKNIKDDLNAGKLPEQFQNELNPETVNAAQQNQSDPLVLGHLLGPKVKAIVQAATLLGGVGPAVGKVLMPVGKGLTYPGVSMGLGAGLNSSQAMGQVPQPLKSSSSYDQGQ